MDSSKKNVSRRAVVAGGAVAAAAMGLGLSGCGGGSTTTTTTTPTDAPATGTSTAGQELTAAVAYETKNYHPSSTSSALALGANWHVVEGLYELDMSTFEPYAALADGDPVKVSDTEYTVKLRSGAKYGDGTQVTAADVVASYERTNTEGSLYVPMISWIASVDAVDETTVSIKTAFPFNLVKERLSLIKVVPATATDEELTAKPIGSGPWTYDSIDEKTITFAVNSNYTGKKAAKPTSMKWDIIKDSTARTTAMQEGSVMVMEDVPSDVTAQVEASGATVDPVQGFALAFFMFNTKKAPFDDYRVRQAFFYAIDMEKLIKNQMSDMASPLKSFLPEDHANFHQAATVYTYDQAKAKSLLAEAGVSNLSITLDTTDASWITAISAQIKNDLDAVGITTEIKSQASSSLYSNRCDVDNPEFDVVLAPGDPSVFGNDPDLLMSWWYGDNTWTKKRSQWGGSEKFNELQTLMQAAREAEGTEQQAKWNECFDLLAEQVPLYPLFHRKIATGYYADKVTGFKPIGTTGLNFIDTATK